MREHLTFRNTAILVTLVALGLIGWTWLRSDNAPTATVTQTVTGPVPEASAPATTETTPTPTAPKATDDPLATSPVDPTPTTTKSVTTTNPLRCDQTSWRAGVGPLKGKELVANVAGLSEVPANTTTVFLGGEVTCVDKAVHLGGKPLSVTDLVATKGFLEAIKDSRSQTLTMTDGRKVDVGSPLGVLSTADRAHAPDKLATK